MRDIDLIIFSLWISSFPIAIYQRLVFSDVCFWHLMALFLGPLFCPIDLHVCFCANTISSLSLWLCSVLWDQVLCTSGIVILLKISSVIKVFWCFPVGSRTAVFYCEDCYWNFGGVVLTLSTSFGNVTIFTVASIYSCRSFLNSLMSSWTFSSVS